MARSGWGNGELEQAALRELRDAGVAGFRVAALADDVGLGRAALAFRLGPREDLVARLWLEGWERYVLAVVEALEASTYAVAVGQAIAAACEALNEDPVRLSLVFGARLQVLVGSDLSDRVLGSRWQELSTRLTHALLRFEERWFGDVVPDRSAVLRFALVDGPVAHACTEDASFGPAGGGPVPRMLEDQARALLGQAAAPPKSQRVDPQRPGSGPGLGA
jgi:hypothetical protein